MLNPPRLNTADIYHSVLRLTKENRGGRETHSRPTRHIRGDVALIILHHAFINTLISAVANLFGCTYSQVGFAAALEAPRDWFAPLAELRAELDAAILANGGEIVARASPRIPTIASYRMPGVGAAAQLIRLDMAGFAVSAGSACSSGKAKPSIAMVAMGLDGLARSTIRVSGGWGTTEADWVRFADVWEEAFLKHRARHPEAEPA